MPAADRPGGDRAAVMLPIHGDLAKVREDFARQFTPEGRDYLYRRGQRGAAFRVTAQERDGLVADFNRGLRRLFWGGIVVVIVALGLLEWRPAILPPAARPWRETIVAGAAALAGLLFWWRLWTAPAQLTDRRVAVAPPLARATRLRANIAGLGWSPLALGAAATLVLIVEAVRMHPFDRAALIYLVGGAVGLGFFVAMGWIKWRLR